jgi:hypothetical protein
MKGPKKGPMKRRTKRRFHRPTELMTDAPPEGVVP